MIKLERNVLVIASIQINIAALFLVYVNIYFFCQRIFLIYGPVGDYAISRAVIEKIFSQRRSMDGSGPDQE